MDEEVKEQDEILQRIEKIEGNIKRPEKPSVVSSKIFEKQKKTTKTPTKSQKKV